MKGLTLAYDILFPRFCLVCKRRIRSDSPWCTTCSPLREHLPTFTCSRCLSTLLGTTTGECSECRERPLPFRVVRAAWEYRGNVQEIISVMKYRPSLRLAIAIAAATAARVPDLFVTRDWDLIVPVPISASRLRERGFNQCAVLAAQLVTKIGTSADYSFLRRINNPPPQASLPHHKRMKNSANGFAPAPRNSIPRSVLLVDDVITTGATAAAAARALRSAGVKNVDLLTIAFAPVWREYRGAIG